MPNKAVQLYQLLRSTRRDLHLGTVIFFVTSRCNAKCETCFYHEELNRPGDLSFEQIERVSRTMPPITDLCSRAASRRSGTTSKIIQTFVATGVRRVIIPPTGSSSAVYDIVERRSTITRP